MRLVLLWFATWKNNGPNYAPEWVKLDNKRFPRVITSKGEVLNSLSHRGHTLCARLSFENRVWGAAQPDDSEKRSFDLGRWTATASWNEWQFGMKEWTSLKGDPPEGREVPDGGVLMPVEWRPDRLRLELHYLAAAFARATRDLLRDG